MKHHYRRLLCAAGLSVALSAVCLTGCNRVLSQQNQPSDMVIDLGDKTVLRFVKIDPMNLFASKYEVSNKMYRRFKPDHDSGQHNRLNLNQDDQPVVNVSWNDAQQFCEWLTKTHGAVDGRSYRFRLPTEKEWETLAGCGQVVEYPWGPDWPPPKNWNYFGRENPEPAQKLDNNDGSRVACTVQRSGANDWRLFGMGGNVWEWCGDVAGQSKSRCYKGASWTDCNPYFLKLSRRSSNAADYKSVTIGFRPMAEISAAGAGLNPEAVPEREAAEAKPETKPAVAADDGASPEADTAP